MAKTTTRTLNKTIKQLQADLSRANSRLTGKLEFLDSLKNAVFGKNKSMPDDELFDVVVKMRAIDTWPTQQENQRLWHLIRVIAKDPSLKQEKDQYGNVVGINSTVQF